MIDIEYYLILSAAIFSIGVYGVLARRNAVLILMSIELMLQAVNINLIAFSLYLNSQGGIEQHLGMIIALFVITVAAAEVGLALAIILRLYRNRASVNVDEVNLMKW